MTHALIMIFNILSHTPFWVWLVLVVMVWRGLKSTQPREIGLPNLIVLPLILAGLASLSIFSTGLSASVIAGLGIGALLGVAAGLQLERRFSAVAVGNRRIHLVGEWTSLGVVLTVFITRYVKAVTAIMNPALATNATFLLIITAISVFSATMLLTRTAMRLKVMLGAARPMPAQSR